jgi:hypothetical protein
MDLPEQYQAHDTCNRYDHAEENALGAEYHGCP